MTDQQAPHAILQPSRILEVEVECESCGDEYRYGFLPYHIPWDCPNCGTSQPLGPNATLACYTSPTTTYKVWDDWSHFAGPEDAMRAARQEPT